MDFIPISLITFIANVSGLLELPSVNAYLEEKVLGVVSPTVSKDIEPAYDSSLWV